ncbi:MAG: hypothetical protein E6649_13805 [Paeniclostridium sordellii]|nr:hypothetical protein [Paeniclostridium sordellii]
MLFNDTDILIKSSNEDLNIFCFIDGIVLKRIKKNLNDRYSIKIIDGIYSFVDFYADINNDDEIYGILNDKSGFLWNIYIDEKNSESIILNKELILKYDNEISCIKFPYIKYLKKETHIIYYLINKDEPFKCELIHINKEDNLVIKNKIDFSHYNIISNFEVLWEGSIPILFYFKCINGYEELFVSKLESKDTWSEPIKITNTKKTKVYLSVIKDNAGCFNIVFSEESDGKYHCRYIKGELKGNTFYQTYTETIKTDIMCLFPHLINYKDTSYIQWGEYNYLYTCESNDLGNTWSSSRQCDKDLGSYSKRYLYKSNFIDDKDYILNSVFGHQEYDKMINYKIKDNI